MEIIFESKDFVAVNKQALVLSVPSRKGLEDSRPCCGTELQAKLKQQIYPIHRLDFEVSGLLLFAKNEWAHRLGNSWFEKNKVRKTYQALTLKNDKFKLGEKYEWKSKLLKGKKRAYEHELGKDSLTHAKVESFHIISGLEGMLWTLEPLTGRSHQLRFEMYRQECPILGDKLYGSNNDFVKGIALKAVKLDFSACEVIGLEISKIIEIENLV